MRALQAGRIIAAGALLAVIATSSSFAQSAAPSRFQVFFDWDKYALTAEAKKTLEVAAAEFKRTGVVNVEAVGHTDTTGSKEYNLRLSERRANAVKAELVRLGVPGGVITTKGVGFSQLLVPTGPGVRELKNRRVEITAVSPAKPVAAAPAPAPAAAPPPPPAPKKWSVSLGPWYGYSFRETDRNDDLTASLLGAQLGVDYAITPEWSVGIAGVGYNTLDTSRSDGWGGRGAFGVTHQWNLGQWHPYIGPSIGYYLGSGVQDGLFVGPKIGVKYDISDTLFAYGQIAYDSLFRNDFGQGVANASIGAGYRF